jgi:16S rRNA (cytidine1402-2'-O)-methyltransferase
MRAENSKDGQGRTKATLYVVGVPATDADDLTLRARRILDEVSRIIVEDVDAPRVWLTHQGIGTPVVLAGEVGSIRQFGQTGDVALLYGGPKMAPAGDLARLVEEAIEAKVPVVPIPGPASPITALVLSGLPADSFVYLGELPVSPTALADLLSTVRGDPLTILAAAGLQDIGGTLAQLFDLLGDRPLAISTGEEGEAARMWRGSLQEAAALAGSLPEVGACSLVIGGSREEPEPWAENRVRAQVEILLHKGLGVKEISQQVSGESGWARRDVYDFAVRIRKGS